MRWFLLLLPIIASAQTRYCSKIDGEIVLNKTYLTISYSPKDKNPNYTAYVLTPEMLRGNVARESEFYADTDLPVKDRVYSSYYTGSGYDRGHMAPAADFHFSKEAMHESFSMANICPQRAGLNRSSWLALEKMERAYAGRCDSLFVITGRVSGEQSFKGVNVPIYFYKTLVGVKNKRVVFHYAWIYRNIDTSQSAKECETTIEELERKTGNDLYQGFWFDRYIQSN